MPLGTGERLGPYEISDLLGAGGMGEVYRARDPRLGRDVAVKISSAEFSDRFEREARAIAAFAALAGFDVAADGRLLTVRPADSDRSQGPRRLLVQNWPAAIGR
jgi:hypothetical protein